MLLTFYERFTFSLGNAGKWLLSAVYPAPQTWHCKPGLCSFGVASRSGKEGMIATLTVDHVKQCANWQAGID